MCVCVRVCACVRVCVRVCVCAYVCMCGILYQTSTLHHHNTTLIYFLPHYNNPRTYKYYDIYARCTALLTPYHFQVVSVLGQTLVSTCVFTVNDAH